MQRSSKDTTGFAFDRIDNFLNEVLAWETY